MPDCMAQLEHHIKHQKIVGSIPGFHPQLGCKRRQPINVVHQCFSHPLPPLLLSLESMKISSAEGLKKQVVYAYICINIYANYANNRANGKTLLKGNFFITRASGQKHKLLLVRNLNPLKVKKLNTD